MNNIIVFCPTCQIRVIPRSDGTCPGCQRDLSNVKATKGSRQPQRSAAAVGIVPQRPVRRPARQVELEAPPLSPLLSICTQPRETIRRIVATKPTEHVITLTMLGGLVGALQAASSSNAGVSTSLPLILVICIIFGTLLGIISLYVNAEVMRWIGGLLGGKASAQDVRAALAWSNVPTIFLLPVWVIAILVFRQELFMTAKPGLQADLALLVLFLVFLLIEVTAGLWSFIVFLHSLGEVHGFSAWRALATDLLSALAFFIPIMLILLALGIT